MDIQQPTQQEEGYELPQLGSLRKISGTLKIVNLENVKHKDEAVKARLVEKKNLKMLELIWGESADRMVLDLDVIEALQPPPNLGRLSINGYRNSRYPAWLGGGSQLPNLEFLNFSNCKYLTALPPNLSQFCNCQRLTLRNLGALREVCNLPECLRELHINTCPCLILVCADELQINDKPIKIKVETRRPSMMQFNELLSKYFEKYAVLHREEVKIFKQTVLVDTCSEQLRILEDASIVDAPEPEQWENLMSAWWHCHQQSMNFIFTSSRANRLRLPTKLCSLNLSYCCVSNGALSDCLSGMADLEYLCLEGIMTITTLPSEFVLQSVQSLRVLKIKHCWCLRSFGGLHALAKLEEFQLKYCWGLEMECDYTRLPPTLQPFSMDSCVVPQGILMGDLPCLQIACIANCQVSGTVSFGPPTALEDLVLMDRPNLSSVKCFKSRPIIDKLLLMGVPRLVAQSLLKSLKGCRTLITDSSEILDELLADKEFAPPQIIAIWTSFWCY